ncbi:MAG: hypothetical protein HY807_08435 [Nitrospirae bacterium]|nr:hypothetical protein [Nitrospirota bacterium]
MKLREERGFTLIELALILIIIGIIISLVLKGQDVIESSRMKKFETDVRHWRTSAWLFLERKGAFPGDGDSNGIIGDEATAVLVPGSTVILNANLINPPKANPVSAGSLNFWLYWGTNDASGTLGRKRNVMVICANNDCTQPFEGDDSGGNMKYVEFLDTVIDGARDGTVGLIRAVSTSPLLEGSGDDRTVREVSEAGTAWTSGSTVALVYYIDKNL